MWIATVASQFGAFIQTVGAGWAMAELAPSATMVALVQTAANLPVMLLAIAGGVLADLVDRRRLMLATQLSMLVLSGLLWLLATGGLLTPWLLLALTFLIGCGGALDFPAWQASVGELVPREQIPAAVGTNILGANVARSTGPAIGGWIVLVAGAGAAFLVNMLSYVGIVVVLWRWRRPAESMPAEPRRFLPMLVDGLRFGLRTEATRTVYVRGLFFGLGAAAIWGLMPTVAIRLRGGPDLLGLLFGAYGLGGIVGAAASVALRQRFGSEGVGRIGIAAVAVGALLIGAVPWAPVAILAHAVAGTGWVLSLSTFNVSIQLAVPRAYVGRTLALYQTTVFGGVALGSGLWGALADRTGVATAMLAAGGFLAAAGVGGVLLRPGGPVAEG